MNDLLHDLRNLEQVRDGNEMHFLIGYTQEQSVVIDERRVDDDRTEILLLQRLLDGLQPEAVA